MADFDPDAYLKKKQPPAAAPFDPDAYLKSKQPETALQTFGRSTASLADTALNAVTGTLDLGARQFARAYYGGIQGMRGDALEQKIAQETTSPKDVVGRTFGVTGTAGYENAPLRALGTAVAPVIEENVIAPIAESTGLSPQYVGDVVGLGTTAVAPGAGRAATATGRAVVSGAKALPQVVEGAVGTATGKIAKPGVQPEVWQSRSSRQPATETYHPAQDIQAWKSGEIPTEQVRTQPWTAEQRTALGRTQGNVPFKGEVPRAIGEQLVEPYTSVKGWLPDVALGVGGTLLGVGPVVGPAINMARRGIGAVRGIRQAGAMNQLGEVGFTPLFKEELTALNKGQPHPSVIMNPAEPGFDFRAASQAANAQAPTPTPVAPPRLTYNPTPETIYVAPEGVASTDIVAANRAGIEQKYPPVTVGPVAPESVPTAPVTKATAEPVAPVAPAGESLLGQKLSTEEILAQIQARSGKKGAGVFETAGETPAAPIDLTANRAKFIDKINQHRAGMEETRAQNKETYSGTAENLGRGTEAERLERMTPAERADYFLRQSTKSEGMTDAAVVKDMIGTTTNTGIRRYKNTNIVDNAVFDEFAADAGVLLDWKSAPDISKMGWAEGRKAMNDWMYKQIKTEANDLGLDVRTGGIRGQVKAMEEANKDIQGLNANEEAAAVKAAQERMKKLRGSSMEMMGKEPQTTFANKKEFQEQQIIDKLSGKQTTGSYVDNGKLYEYIVNPVLKGVPPELQGRLGPQVKVIVTDLSTGKVTKDFKTSGDLIKERMKKGK